MSVQIFTWAQEEAFNRANFLYEKEAYPGTIRILDSLYQAGYSSFPLYYNLGNAYLGNKEIGKAILFYERALQIKNTDALENNLAQANMLVNEPIPTFSDFFLVAWWYGILESIGSNGFAVIAVLCLLLGVIILYVKWLKGTARFSAWHGFISLGLSLILLMLSWAAYVHDRDLSFGVVMKEQAVLYESSDNRSNELRMLSEGIKVKVLDELQSGWIKVQLPDKDVGWVSSGEVVLL